MLRSLIKAVAENLYLLNFNYLRFALTKSEFKHKSNLQTKCVGFVCTPAQLAHEGIEV